MTGVQLLNGILKYTILLMWNHMKLISQLQYTDSILLSNVAHHYVTGILVMTFECTCMCVSTP